MKIQRNKLTIPSSATVLDCFNTSKNTYSNGSSEFYLLSNDSNSINSIFIIGLFSYLHQNYNIYDESSFIIRTEDLRAFCGYSRGGKSKSIKEELLELKNIKGIVREETIRLADVKIQGRQTAITSKYFNELANAMRENSRKKDGNFGSSYMSIVYADIAKTKNNAASEIAIELCKVIERRGSIGNNQVHISINKLIKRCQSLGQKINNASTNGKKNQVLKNDMMRALTLLKEYTSLYEDYEDIEVRYPNRINLLNSKELVMVNHKGKIIKEKGTNEDENR
ncbi:hypothetical protein IZY60_12715 [Lutibacter sp. B2]|nr:hypothetical protein [Lutibacter sp. B2]